jgi:uncharacterized iron-regulated membrane protein
MLFVVPLQVATVASALGWPLALGAAVVIWSKRRAAASARRGAALQAQLQELYRTVEAQPVPDQLTLVMDALAEDDDLAGAAEPHSAKSPAES